MKPGSRIKDVRKSLCMTQTEFGKKIGLKWYKIKDLESGRLRVTEDIAKKINGDYGINYRWILFGEKPKEKLWAESHIISSPSLDIDYLPLNSILKKAKKQYDAKLAKYSRHINGTKSKSEVPIKVYVHFNDPRVRIFAIERAKGKCEICASPAPFRRASDGSPYLEIHHKKPLNLGGEDTPDNIIVVCPNCHRKIHFG